MNSHLFIFNFNSMKNINSFFKRVCYFIGLPILSTILIFSYLNYINNKAINNFKVRNKTTLFLGDSHIQQAINNNLIPNTLNLSQFSESYYFTYFKTKRILKANPSIKKIYLGFSFHNISSYFDDFIFGKYSKDIAAKYFFILPKNEKIRIINENSKNISTLITHTLINGFEISFFGKYDNKFDNVSSNELSMNKRLKQQFYELNKVRDFSFINIKYLVKIIELCKKHKIKLTLINTPLHTYYKHRIPKVFLKKYNEIINHYNLEIINFNDLNLDNSCFVPDGDHVSIKGANIVSKKLFTETK